METQKKQKKRERAFWIWLLVIWSLFAAIPLLYHHHFSVFFTGWAVAAVLLLIAFPFLGICRRALGERLGGVKLQGKAGVFVDRHFFAVAFFGLLLFWLPAYLALFPGTFGYDAPGQVAQYLGKEPWSTYQPVAHSFLMGAVIDLGRTLFGSYNGGVALYTALQALACAAAGARSLVFLKRRQAPFLALLFGFLFLALNPFVQVLVFACTKDIFFGAALLVFVLDFADAADGGRISPGLITGGIFMCAMRNQGIYMILVGCVIFIIIRKKKGFRLAAFLLVIAVCAFGLNFIFIHALKMRSGDRREMLSVPMQQVAAVAHADLVENAGTLTDAELRQIEVVIPREAILSYAENTADPVKTAFNTAAFEADRLGNIKLYVKLGLRHPKMYFFAFADMVLPYWDMTRSMYRGLAIRYTWPEITHEWDIHRASLLPACADYLIDAVVNLFYDRVPFARIFEPGYSIFLMAAVFLYGVIFRRKTAFFTQMFIFLYFLTCLLGPVALLRYMFPILLAVPVMAGTFFIKKE